MINMKRTIGRLMAVAAVAVVLAGLGAEVTMARNGGNNTHAVTQTGGRN